MSRPIGGICTGADRENGTASANLNNGIILGASPYLGLAPWAGSPIEAEQVGPAQWVIRATVGQRDDFGPNVFSNPNGANRGNELITAPSFETGITEDGWLAFNNATLAQSSTLARTGTFSLRVTKTVGTGNPVIASASKPVVQGRGYNAHIWTRAATSTRTQSLSIQFRDLSGTVIDTVTSPAASNATGSWTEYWITGQAPAGAVTANIKADLSTLSTAVNGEIHYVDDVSLSEQISDLAVSGAQAWRFDANVEGWSAGGGATIAWSSSAGTGSSIVTPLSGAGAVLMTASTSGTRFIESPTTTSGVAVVAGRLYTAFAFSHPVGTGTVRSAHVGIDWWNSGGGFISATVGADVSMPNGIWTQLIVQNVTAPAGAAFASVYVEVVSAGAGQQWMIDTAALVTPANARVRRNEDATYVLAEGTSIQMTSIAGGITIAQVLPGVNGDATGAAKVQPGEIWVAEADWKNHVSNSIYRVGALVATWYDTSGNFIGITLGQTPITPNPGSGWGHTKETFTAPAGAGFIRLRLLTLAGAAGDTLYWANVALRQGENAPKRLVTQGPIVPFTQDSVSDMGVYNTIADTWTMGPWQYVMTNPRMPVTVKAHSSGYANTDAGFAQFAVRMGMTMDGGATWDYSPYVYGWTDVGYIRQTPVAVTIEKTDLPVGDIYVWCEIWFTGFATCWYEWVNVSYSVMAA